MKDLNRKEFLKTTLIAGVGSTFVGRRLIKGAKETKSTNPFSPKSGNRKSVIVAGGGISGLCCAYELMKRGHEVVVLEANGRYGGHVFTGRDGLSDGLYADFGADHITKPGYEYFFKYAEEFGLPVLPYPNAEGSPSPKDENSLKMIDGKFYTGEMLADPAVLRNFGFHPDEIKVCLPRDGGR